MSQKTLSSIEIPGASPLHFAKLSKENLFQILELQNLVWSDLSDEKKSFIVKKEEEDFQKNMNKPNYGLGLFSKNNELMGMAFLLHPTSDARPHGLTPCKTTDNLIKECTGESIGVVCTVMVHPDYRKKGLMGIMLEQLHTIALGSGFDVLISEVAVANDASSNGFMHHGYEISGSDHDPADNTRLMFMKQRLTPAHCHTKMPALVPVRKIASAFIL